MTSKLSDEFLLSDGSPATPPALQKEITRHLEAFWREVFGYRKGGKPPSFEDHFTMLDLAANAGHNLGAKYSPASLRAIRRLSIHRVFDVLDAKFGYSHHLEQLLNRIARGRGNVIVSTNWDVVVENHLRYLQKAFYYGIPIEHLDGGVGEPKGVPLLKLHGSSNWAYCDACRRLFVFSSGPGKGTLHSRVFLEQRDFDVLGGKRVRIPRARKVPTCPYCETRLSARVATFSFEKAMSYFQYQGVWQEALRHLRTSDSWVFIGYSLPDADFELRHLLKTAELAARPKRPSITVVTYSDGEVVERYRRFFGPRVAVVTGGLEKWVEMGLDT